MKFTGRPIITKTTYDRVCPNLYLCPLGKVSPAISRDYTCLISTNSYLICVKNKLEKCFDLDY